MNPRRLYRSRDHQLAGVAGGMAEYLDIDPTFVRILWILAVLASAGLAIVAYVVLAIVIPQAPYAAAAPGSWAAGPGAPAAPGWSSVPPAWDARWAVTSDQSQARPRGVGIGAIVGVVLVVIGVLALVDVAIPGWVAGPLIGPAVILTLGAALLVASLRPRGVETAGSASMPATGPDPAAASAAPGSSTAPAPSEPWATTPEPWATTDTEPVDPRQGAG